TAERVVLDGVDPQLARRRQRITGRVARRAHRAGLRPTGDPVDEGHTRRIACRKQGVAVVVADVDPRDVLRPRDGLEEALQQRRILCGSRPLAPTAEAGLDIGEERMAADRRKLTYCLQGLQRLLPAVRIGIARRTERSAEAPIAMRIIWPNLGSRLGVETA